ncbi:MAG: PilZ domain-containing protein [Chloroflexi bacterium]|nr:PilZ domain-containing protein [Chloroflexota bacterium]
MSGQDRTSWYRRLYQRLLGESTEQPDIIQLHERRPAEVVAEPDDVVSLNGPAESERAVEDCRVLLGQGRRVAVTWDGGPEHGSVMAQGEVRLTFDDTVWIWLDQELPESSRPRAGQALQVLAPRPDALRLIPCRLVEPSNGGSLQVAISGRASRLQRREDVRALVDMPPISAVRLGLTGRPQGLLGVRVVDLSAGGIRMQTDEMLRAGQRLRLVLRLDDGDPITPTVEVLVPGTTAQGRFDPLGEVERRRVVQFVYKQEVAARRRARDENEAEQLAD